MTIEKLHDEIKAIITDKTADGIFDMWNQYCDEAGRYDDVLYLMDDFNEVMSGRDPLDIAMTVAFGDFCPADDYFFFDGYANIRTCSRPGQAYDPSPVDIDELVAYAIENESSLGDEDIAELLDRFNDEVA